MSFILVSIIAAFLIVFVIFFAIQQDKKRARILISDKSRLQTKISRVFVWVALGILAAQVSVVYFTDAQVLTKNNDISEWFSLVIGSGIGIGIAISLLIYSDETHERRKKYAILGIIPLLEDIIVEAEHIENKFAEKRKALDDKDKALVNTYLFYLKKMSEHLEDWVRKSAEDIDPDLRDKLTNFTLTITGYYNISSNLQRVDYPSRSNIQIRGKELQTELAKKIKTPLDSILKK